MAGINPTALKTVHKTAVYRRHVLHHHTEIRLVENVQNLMEAILDSLLHQSGVIDDLLDFQGHIADYHRQGEIFHRTGPRNSFQPRPLGIGTTLKNPAESLPGNCGITIISGSLG